MPCIHVHMLRALLRRRVGVALGLQEIVEAAAQEQHAACAADQAQACCGGIRGERFNTAGRALHAVMLSWA